MASPRWLLISAFVPFSAVVFAACSDGAAPTTGTTSGTSSGMGGMGGMGGGGGAGGAPGTTASTGTGAASPDAGPPAPLVCKSHTYSTIKVGPCDLLQQDCPVGKTCKEFPSADGTWT